MFSLTPQIRYYVCTRMIDMRNGIDGLYSIIQSEFGLSPTNGDAFVFFSRNGDKVKILRWDGDGFVLYLKRLEKGTFERTQADACGNVHAEISWNTFNLIICGVSLSKAVYRKRFSLNKQ